MNLDLQSLLEQLKGASSRSKATAAITGLALVCVLAVAGVVAGRPHYVVFQSGLDDRDSAAVQEALAQGGIAFTVSGFPGPFVVYVSEGRVAAAHAAVALAGALKRDPRGIVPGQGGASSVFQGARERTQSAWKREWEETEQLLETLDFVSEAKVVTSTPPETLFGRKGEGLSASVALHLRGGATLTREQQQMAARLVTYRFDVPADRVIITDQYGNSLYDPSGAEGGLGHSTDLLAQEAQRDERLALQAMQSIEMAYGSGRAHVTVHSEWDYDQVTEIESLPDPQSKVVRESHTSSSKTPQGAPTVGGTPGMPSSVGDGGLGLSGAGATGSSAGRSAEETLASTKEERMLYATGNTTKSTVRSGPRLKKRTVSLLIDEKLADELGERLVELEEAVQAAVGYDAARGDVFETATAPFQGDPPALDKSGQPITEGGGGVSRMLELLLERGIEIVAAVAFIVLLFKSLRGGSKRKAQAEATSAREAAAERERPVEIDPEVVAREQVEELIQSDPERVGKILSRWAREDKLVGSGQ